MKQIQHRAGTGPHCVIMRVALPHSCSLSGSVMKLKGMLCMLQAAEEGQEAAAAAPSKAAEKRARKKTAARAAAAAAAGAAVPLATAGPPEHAQTGVKTAGAADGAAFDAGTPAAADAENGLQRMSLTEGAVAQGSPSTSSPSKGNSAAIAAAAAAVGQQEQLQQPQQPQAWMLCPITQVCVPPGCEAERVA
jgi:hypothetical protein